jgi:uncharacterized damage-inducible protein DinB
MTTSPRRVDPLIAELERESKSTRRLLEAIPDDRLSWKPHARSMTLGQLAHHIAAIPLNISGFLEMTDFEPGPDAFMPPEAASRQALLATFEEGLATARRRLDALDDARGQEIFRMMRGGKEVFALPKLALMRTVLLNHLYHHRGQLTVYLRLLDVTVPATYGRSADEIPFA